jgi:hypothetical protein
MPDTPKKDHAPARRSGTTSLCTFASPIRATVASAGSFPSGKVVV